jgi:uncharacterized protein VcgC/VcgE DUF2780
MSMRSLPFRRPAMVAAALLTAVACSKNNPEPSTMPNPATSPTTGMSALPASLNAAAPLLNSVASQVPGLSQAQQILGVGSMFGLAKQKMPSDQYSQLSGAVPGADALATEATKQGLPMNAGGLSDITNFLGKSGITPDQVTKLVPALTNSLKGKVSPELLNAFTNALM